MAQIMTHGSIEGCDTAIINYIREISAKPNDYENRVYDVIIYTRRGRQYLSSYELDDGYLYLFIFVFPA